MRDRVRFRREDLFETDLRPASIVTLYLFQNLNLELRPRLLQQLRPGTRVVSHAFHMGDWQPDTVVAVRVNQRIEFTVTERVNGRLLTRRFSGRVTGDGMSGRVAGGGAWRAVKIHLELRSE